MGISRKIDYIWVIAYINRDHIHSVEKDLLDRGFGTIRVFIPTVRILKKQFKNKNIYEYIPLLFNYGFFQIPYNKACDAEFLKVLREKIPAIYAWVLDPINVIKTRPTLRPDNKGNMEEPEVNEDGLKILRKYEKPKVAIATEEEIVNLLKASENLSVFSDGVVDKLEIGSFITLRGYPYDGMPAEIISISKEKKTVKVKLLLETMIANATVSFENIFYTVYSNMDESCKEVSIEDLGLRGSHSLDKLYTKISYGDDE